MTDPLNDELNALIADARTKDPLSEWRGVAYLVVSPDMPPNYIRLGDVDKNDRVPVTLCTRDAMAVRMLGISDDEIAAYLAVYISKYLPNLAGEWIRGEK